MLSDTNKQSQPSPLGGGVGREHISFQEHHDIRGARKKFLQQKESKKVTPYVQ